MFCYQKNFSNPTLPVDEAQFNALVMATKWNENIDKYRETGDASLKRKLPAFIFQATFDETESAKGKKGRWRKQSATRLTGLVVMDIDHLDDANKIYEDMRTKVDFEKEGILLIYVTPSGHGLKIVFKAKTEWGNLIDNQHAMAKLLGVEVDESCKDASRMSFICKETDILFFDKELFTYENKAYGEKYDALYRAGNSSSTKADAKTHQVAGQGSGEKRPMDNRQVENNDVKWRGYDVQSIINQRYVDKLPCKEDSNRHTESLKLATDLLLMLDGDKALVRKIVEAQPWVQEIIAERDEDVAQTVESAASCIKEKEKKYAGSLPSKAMQEAVKTTCGLTYQEIIRGVKGVQECRSADNTNSTEIEQMLEAWGEEIEQLFPSFPILKDICKGLKRNQYPAAMFVAGGLMMTLMTRCTYRFYHRPEELRRLNSSTLIIGDPASGKSFATRLYRLLAAPIIEADKAGKDAINAYREMMKTKGANKEKPKKPKVVVRVHPSRTSNAQFIQDMVNAVEVVDGKPMQLHMLTFDTELDNTLSVQKGGSWIDKMSLELKAFHNEEDGQAYSNLDSILQDFYVTWNYIYTGTPIALKKKVNAQNFGSGLATRLTCIPLPTTNFEMLARENSIDLDSDERLKEWAVKLDKTKGELSVQKVVDELFGWTERRMEDAKENESKADEMLLKRCAYHGMNFSAPFIVMRHWEKLHEEGGFWCGEFETDEVDWKLAELIVNIQYSCQRHYFGALAEKYFDDKLRDASVNVQRRQKTIEGFSRLPETFTSDDVAKCFSLNNYNTIKSRIKRLLKDKLIVRIEEYGDNGNSKSRYAKTGMMMV
jgi:hypothetical protein